MIRDRKHIHVTCAIIEQDGRILSARRGPAAAMPDKWEFPGGKIDPGEGAEECLRRELREELGIGVTIRRRLPPHSHDYPDFRITLHPFVCTVSEGEMRLCDHAEFRWAFPAELRGLDWAAADVPVLEHYITEETAR